jgi:hypothetical protein
MLQEFTSFSGKLFFTSQTITLFVIFLHILKNCNMLSNYLIPLLPTPSLRAFLLTWMENESRAICMIQTDNNTTSSDKLFTN